MDSVVRLRYNCIDLILYLVTYILMPIEQPAHRPVRRHGASHADSGGMARLASHMKAAD